jgi:dGTPase
MEVAQIARGIVLKLRNDNPSLWSKSTEAGQESVLPALELIEAVGFCHDLGHPPFGHSGERALNYVMRDHGGFEGNGHTLRLVANRESRKEGYGLDLTRRTLLGVLKYPASYRDARNPNQNVVQSDVPAPGLKPPKCYLDTESEVVEWMLEEFGKEDREHFAGSKRWQRKPGENGKHGKTRYASLDTEIMEVADDIAYGVHDLEDGIVLDLISRTDVEHGLADADRDPESVFKRDMVDKLFKERSFKDLLDGLFSGDGNSRKEATGALVNALVSSVRIEKHDLFEHPLLDHHLKLEKPARLLLDVLENISRKQVIFTQQVQTLEHRGRLIIRKLFEALDSEPMSLLDRNRQQAYREAEESGCESDAKRVICDYIAGMTDEYATRMYERLFVPREGTVFDRL